MTAQEALRSAPGENEQVESNSRTPRPLPSLGGVRAITAQAIGQTLEQSSPSPAFQRLLVFARQPDETPTPENSLSNRPRSDNGTQQDGADTSQTSEGVCSLRNLPAN